MTNLVLVAAGKVHAKFIWNWRNDPLTRQMFFNGEKISWKEHSSWYENALSDDSMKLYVGEEKNIPVGMVRFDKCDKEKSIFEVSINISPENRGKGLGKKLLTSSLFRIFNEELDCRVIKANVKKHNEYSNKLFRSCGFIFCGEKPEINIYEFQKLFTYFQ